MTREEEAELDNTGSACIVLLSSDFVEADAAFS